MEKCKLIEHKYELIIEIDDLFSNYVGTHNLVQGFDIRLHKCKRCGKIKIESKSTEGKYSDWMKSKADVNYLLNYPKVKAHIEQYNRKKKLERIIEKI